MGNVRPGPDLLSGQGVITIYPYPKKTLYRLQGTGNLGKCSVIVVDIVSFTSVQCPASSHRPTDLGPSLGTKGSELYQRLETS